MKLIVLISILWAGFGVAQEQHQNSLSYDERLVTFIQNHLKNEVLDSFKNGLDITFENNPYKLVLLVSKYVYLTRYDHDLQTHVYYFPYSLGECVKNTGICYPALQLNPDNLECEMLEHILSHPGTKITELSSWGSMLYWLSGQFVWLPGGHYLRFYVSENYRNTAGWIYTYLPYSDYRGKNAEDVHEKLEKYARTSCASKFRRNPDPAPGLSAYYFGGKKIPPSPYDMPSKK